jgi:hypothetical protein
MSDVSLIGRLPSTPRSTGAFGFDDGQKTVKMLNTKKNDRLNKISPVRPVAAPSSDVQSVGKKSPRWGDASLLMGCDCQNERRL